VFEPGSLVDGKYRIDRELGQGGMGVVVAATHTTLGTRVALKCMNERVDGDTISTERFLREARAAAQLRSEHICRVLDVGEHDGSPYIVMELLEGTDLGRVVKKRQLDPERAVDYVRQACIGLAEAHASGIIHRDLKPENLFLVRRDDGSQLVKLLDFGVAKAPDSKGLTGTMQMIGSPLYMSPEQIVSSRDVDTRSDVWSLGVILYRLISGRLPFTGINAAELALNICEEPMPPIANVPEGLLAVIARCLEKSPANRFASVEALAIALQPFGTDARETAVFMGPDVADVFADSTTVPGQRNLENATTGQLLAESQLATTAPAVTKPLPAQASPPPLADQSRPATLVVTPRPALRRVALALVGLAVVVLGAAVIWRATRSAPATAPEPVTVPEPAPAAVAAPAPATEPPAPAPAPPASEPAPEPAPPAPSTTTATKPRTKPRPAAKPRPAPAAPVDKPKPTDDEISRSRI